MFVLYVECVSWWSEDECTSVSCKLNFTHSFNLSSESIPMPVPQQTDDFTLYHHYSIDSNFYLTLLIFKKTLHNQRNISLKHHYVLLNYVLLNTTVFTHLICLAANIWSPHCFLFFHGHTIPHTSLPLFPLILKKAVLQKKKCPFNTYYPIEPLTHSDKAFLLMKHNQHFHPLKNNYIHQSDIIDKYKLISI